MGTVNLTKALKAAEDRLKLPNLSKYSKEAKSQIEAARDQVANALEQGSADLLAALKNGIQLALRSSESIEALVDIFDVIRNVYLEIAIKNPLIIGLNVIEDGVLICQVIVESAKVAVKV